MSKKKDKQEKRLEKDRLFVETIDDRLAECPNKVGKMRRLLEKIDTVKERYAIPLKLFPAAAKLREAEHSLQVRIRAAVAEKEAAALRAD